MSMFNKGFKWGVFLFVLYLVTSLIYTSVSLIKLFII